MKEIEVVVDVRQSPDNAELIVVKQKLFADGDLCLGEKASETRLPLRSTAGLTWDEWKPAVKQSAQISPTLHCSNDSNRPSLKPEEADPATPVKKPLPPATAFASRLKALREARGLTQVQLSEASGVSQATISRVEAGRLEPGWETAVRLADALGVSVEEFR
jgi:DNA-binding XRE family transcriptional regulator